MKTLFPRSLRIFWFFITETSFSNWWISNVPPVTMETRRAQAATHRRTALRAAAAAAAGRLWPTAPPACGWGGRTGRAGGAAWGRPEAGSWRRRTACRRALCCPGSCWWRSGYPAPPRTSLKWRTGFCLRLLISVTAKLRPLLLLPFWASW